MLSPEFLSLFELDGVEVRRGPFGLGLFATRDLSVGAVVVRTPLRNVLTGFSALSLLGTDAPPGPRTPAMEAHHISLALLRIRDTPSHPLFPYARELSLGPPPSPVDESWPDFAAEPEQVQAAALALRAGATGQLAWALACFHSRALTVPRERADVKVIRGTTAGMVPGVDLANHRDGSLNVVRGAGAAVELVLGREVKQGEEVTISYGSLSDTQKRARFGF
jgi:hypothetical protein